jgi:hypothetical protein
MTDQEINGWLATARLLFSTGILTYDWSQEWYSAYDTAREVLGYEPRTDLEAIEKGDRFWDYVDALRAKAYCESK